MNFGIDFYGNINHRKAYFKQILQGQQEPEVVIEEWLRKFCNRWLKEEFCCQSGAEWYEQKKAAKTTVMDIIEEG
jgi:hypothetical protein